MRLEEIIQRVGLNPDPYSFAGRGATTADLNSNILHRIHAGIRKFYGDEAARNFVLMVEELPKLSGVMFLENLYALENNGWQWTGVSLIETVEVTRSSSPMSHRDETAYIRKDFLARFGHSAHNGNRRTPTW